MEDSFSSSFRSGFWQIPEQRFTFSNEEWPISLPKVSVQSSHVWCSSLITWESNNYREMITIELNLCCPGGCQGNMTEAKETSGDDGKLLLGRHVGMSRLFRMMRGLNSMESESVPPLESEREESHASWWVLKSPTMGTFSSGRLKIEVKSGR